jgi:hypothetical protein
MKSLEVLRTALRLITSLRMYHATEEFTSKLSVTCLLNITMKSTSTICLPKYQYFHFRIDGLKSGPIYLGDVTNNGDWWGIAKPAIEEVTPLPVGQRFRRNRPIRLTLNEYFFFRRE